MSDLLSLRAAGYDWLEIWQRMYDDERAQAERVTEPGFEQQVDQWQMRAIQFAAASRQMQQPDGFMRLLVPRLQSTDCVLDIGAGTGRHVSILAQAVARVIVMEPSAAMRHQLEQRVATEGLQNVEIVEDWWPSKQPIEADVVISVNVVYAVQKLAPFLHAMHVTARRACYLFLGLQHPTESLAPLWKQFRGDNRLPLPAALEALNVLHQLGYPASMEVVPNQSVLWYADADAALADVRQRLRFVPHVERDREILHAIHAQFVQHADGSLAPPHQLQLAAALWWQRS